MTFGILALILSTHYVADFLLQSSWMAENKSKAWKPLLAHVGVYTLCLVPFGLQWASVNGEVHLLVDYFTSRASARLFRRNEYHWAFAVIGLDQLIHALTLFGTWEWLSWFSTNR